MFGSNTVHLLIKNLVPVSTVKIEEIEIELLNNMNNDKVGALLQEKFFKLPIRRDRSNSMSHEHILSELIWVAPSGPSIDPELWINEPMTHELPHSPRGTDFVTISETKWDWLNKEVLIFNNFMFAAEIGGHPWTPPCLTMPDPYINFQIISARARGSASPDKLRRTQILSAADISSILHLSPPQTHVREGLPRQSSYFLSYYA